MTPAARVGAAIEILDEIFAGAPAEKALTGWARRSRFAGSKDRAAVRDHVFDGLRQRRSAAAVGGAADGRGVMLGVLRLADAEPETLFSGEGYAPALLTDSEKAHPEPAELPVDLPDWLVPHLRESLGRDFEETVLALRARAPVCLRVNLKKCTLAGAQDVLRRDDIQTEPMDLADTALKVTEGARRVSQSVAYRDGLVELQDASSQAAIASLELSNGLKIMDYCAGGGGKILAMAARCDGRFFAHDAHVARLRDLPARAKRAGVKISTLADAEAQAPYDLVFCDVPCSGSGTWRRTPDAKWRFKEQDLINLNALQDEILNKAAQLVTHKGTLVYATCSVLTSENLERLSTFVTRFPEWSIVENRQFLMREGGDGFFVAKLRRKSA
ncbi:16S rRNA (cytosine967-C5)-methyltransferase [Shimia isoporae]|uniref:16S rRNA (Cytosine967-C5)-methyltransferase n=1 Tax=Shimia isoporae TaxID=647720 RepID=A0A4R1NW82_9RHOB|nr:RsmB/NOP family class I SAM-dependent RNA methyltransferase [Shimia isoporae]TCL09392.1 16S rRNA (cytosine967-C5)-methyltransferase [Shimia isoporae]